MEDDTSLGFSFQPGNEKRMRKGLNENSLGPRADEALKILSLHLPQFLGGAPLAPENLLGSHPGGAGPVGPGPGPGGQLGGPRPNTGGFEPGLGGGGLPPEGPQMPAPSVPSPTGGGSSSTLGFSGGLSPFKTATANVAKPPMGAPGTPSITPGTGGPRVELPGEFPTDNNPVSTVPKLPKQILSGNNGGGVEGGLQQLLNALLGH